MPVVVAADHPNIVENCTLRRQSGAPEPRLSLCPNGQSPTLATRANPFGKIARKTKTGSAERCRPQSTPSASLPRQCIAPTDRSVVSGLADRTALLECRIENELPGRTPPGM
jgi:hypothetical protein